MTKPLYDTIGVQYAAYRTPDPRIAGPITSALGTAKSVINVGAGTGSYEPLDRHVTAVELSREMIRQRAAHASCVVQARAEFLPFRDRSFEASLAVLTIHHWADWRRGILEMRRVANDRVAILTWDPAHEGFWLVQEYFPDLLEVDRTIFPAITEIQEMLGLSSVHDVPIPWNCSDGFLGAYWRRPQAYLDAGVRGAISTFSKIPDVIKPLGRLQRDLADGAWLERNHSLNRRDELDVGYRLVVADQR